MGFEASCSTVCKSGLHRPQDQGLTDTGTETWPRRPIDCPSSEAFSEFAAFAIWASSPDWAIEPVFESRVRRAAAITRAIRFRRVRGTA